MEFLEKADVAITPLSTGHVALDCDVFAMDNSNTKKEGVSRIYNGEDGYAPIGAYLGNEGWCLELELREGKQHSQCGFIPFLNRILKKARSLTSKKLLVRLDSAHDALETRVACKGHEKVSFIIKWNPRKEDQKQWAKRIFEEGTVTEPRTGKRVGLLTVYFQQVYEIARASSFSSLRSSSKDGGPRWIFPTKRSFGSMRIMERASSSTARSNPTWTSRGSHRASSQPMP